MEILKWFVKLKNDIEIIAADVVELVAHVGILVADIIAFWADLAPYKKKIQDKINKFKKKRK